MLDMFKDEQLLFCEEISSCIKNDKISHAFLIETKNYEKKNELILSFIKELFKKYTTAEEFLNVSTLIDNNTFSDLMIIEADGAFIKQEQILDIRANFKTTSTENRPRIYWIKEADKLNKYAANSLLKFLEEPEGNVIAIIDTDNRYRVIETIRSRCQIYSLVNNKHDDGEIDETIINIINTLETKGVESITYLPMTLENDLRNRDFWIPTFKSMINIYENAIRKEQNLDYTNYGEVLDIIIKTNDTKKIVNKIDVLFTTLSNMDYNLNINMMLDKFIIEFTGGE